MDVNSDEDSSLVSDMKKQYSFYSPSNHTDPCHSPWLARRASAKITADDAADDCTDANFVVVADDAPLQSQLREVFDVYNRRHRWAMMMMM